MPHLSVDCNNWITVEDGYKQRNVVKDIGGVWDGIGNVWQVTFTLYNFDYLINNLESLSICEDIEEKLAAQRAKEDHLDRLRQMSKQDVPVRLKVPGLLGSPYNYQRLGIMYSVINGVGVLLADEMGLGKAQPVDCLVLTPTGWVRMDSIRIGSRVIGANGKSCSVTGVFPQGEKDVYRVVFSDGSSTRCCDEHLWCVNTPLRRWRKMPSRILFLHEIREKGLKHSNGNRQHFIPLVGPVQFEEVSLPLDPYLLGLLLGDGGFTGHTPVFSTEDNELIRFVGAVLPEGVAIRHNQGCDYLLTSGKRGGRENPLTSILRHLGLWHLLSQHKSVPVIYKFSSQATRLELLRGLMDADGWVSKGKRGNAIMFGSSSRGLADDVVFLVRSLGGTARVKPKKTKSLLAFVVTLSLPSDVNPFRLTRKASLVRLREKYVPSRSIEAIHYAGKSKCQCISVDASDGLYVTDDFLVTHNTVQAIATALHLKSKGLVKHALCVTPASLKFNWPMEIEKFTEESYVVIDGSPEKRVAQWLREDVFFYVVNYELLLEDLFGGRDLKKPERREKKDGTMETEAALVLRIRKWSERKAVNKKRERILGNVRRRMWDFVVIDEAQYIRNSSKRTKNVKRLRSRFRMALTGTPIDGRLEELHSIMSFVAPGLLGSKTRFFQRHVEVDWWGRVSGYKRIQEVSDRIKPFFIRRLKKDVLKDLPDKIYQNRVIELSKAEMKIYKALADRGHEVTEDVEAVVAIIRCKQFCNYPLMVDETCKETSKLTALKDVLDEVVVMNGHKALLFSQYKQMLNKLAPVLEDMGIKYLRIDGDTPKLERAQMQKTFKDDKSIDMIMGTDAMSMGLNFAAADFVINYDDRWSPSVMSQREDRAHRIGQRNVVTVINFVCHNTIEERIRRVIYDKNKVTAQVLGDDTDEMVLKRLGPQDMVKLL